MVVFFGLHCSAVVATAAGYGDGKLREAMEWALTLILKGVQAPRMST